MGCERIFEPLDVVASFSEGMMRPRWFRWHKREYRVDRIHLAYSGFDAGVRRFYFSVTSGGNAYKLCYNCDTMEWELQEIYSE